MKKRKLLSVLIAAALSCSLFSVVPLDSHADEPYVAVFRLYNPNSGDHHYTTALGEKNNLVSLGWNDEGIGWYAPITSEKRVFRLYNPNAPSYNHHYTTEKKESEYLLICGWKSEGTGWYSYTGSDGVPVHRLYNPNSGEHHYTLDTKEKDFLISLGWNYEGEAWRGYPADTTEPTPVTPTEPTEPTRDLYAYKTTKYMAENPGCTGKAPIKSDYSDWTTSGLKLVPYEYTSLGKPKVRMYAKYFGDLSQYTGYWGPGPKSSMYYGAVNCPTDGSFENSEEWLNYYKVQNDPVKYWGEGALTAEDVFSWDCGQKVNAAEYPISEEYVYRRMQARITEHDDESPYAADDKDTPTSFDDVYKDWGGDKWYYEPGLKSGACAAYAADIQDYAFGYAYTKIKYKNISIDEMEREYGTDIYEMVDLYGNGNLYKVIKTDIIKKYYIPLKVGDIIRYSNHSSLVTKVYEKNGLIYYETADGNAAGWTAVNIDLANYGLGGTIYTRWTELDQNGNLVPLGINDVEYYANGAHKIETLGTYN